MVYKKSKIKDMAYSIVLLVFFLLASSLALLAYMHVIIKPKKLIGIIGIAIWLGDLTGLFKISHHLCSIKN